MGLEWLKVGYNVIHIQIQNINHQSVIWITQIDIGVDIVVPSGIYI